MSSRRRPSSVSSTSLSKRNPLFLFSQIIHYPEAELATSQVQVVPSGIQTSQYVSAVPAATTYTTVPAATTTYTSVPAATYATNVVGGSTVIRSSGVGLAGGNVGTTYVTGGPLVYGSGYATGVPTTTYTTVGGTKGSLSTVGGSTQIVGGQIVGGTTTYQTSGNVVTSGAPVTTTTTTTYQ